MRCDEVHELLSEYVTDGQPSSGAYATLRVHLNECGPCRGELERLLRVERALRAWPLAEMDPALHAQLMATLRRRVPVELQQGAWAIWLPALTVLLAVCLALWLAPGPLTFSLSSAASHQSVLPNGALFGTDAFQAISVGVALALAGAGLAIALGEDDMLTGSSLTSLRDRATEAAQQIWRFATHSH